MSNLLRSPQDIAKLRNQIYSLQEQLDAAEQAGRVEERDEKEIFEQQKQHLESMRSQLLEDEKKRDEEEQYLRVLLDEFKAEALEFRNLADEYREALTKLIIKGRKLNAEYQKSQFDQPFGEDGGDSFESMYHKFGIVSPSISGGSIQLEKTDYYPPSQPR